MARRAPDAPACMRSGKKTRTAQLMGCGSRSSDQWRGPEDDARYQMLPVGQFVPARRHSSRRHRGLLDFRCRSTLERRELVCQPHRLTRCRFRRRCLKEPPNPDPKTCQSPPMRAGHEHPAEAGETLKTGIRASPYSGPFRKSLFLAVGMLVPEWRPWLSQGTPPLCPVKPPGKPVRRPSVER